jgi:hypothetical protein
LVQISGYYTAKGYPKIIRRIEYVDKVTRKRLIFLTNYFIIKSSTVERLYKERWNVELFSNGLSKIYVLRNYMEILKTLLSYKFRLQYVTI